MNAPRKLDIPALTGLRGAAALLILFYHTTNMLRSDHPGPIGLGYLAVDLFFVLSGFVLALGYAESFLAGPALPAYRIFLWRRFARIYPVYAAISAVTYVVTAWYGMKAPAMAVLSNVLLLQGTGLAAFFDGWGNSLVGPAWSISTELVAYIAFPLIIGAMLRLPWRMSAGFAVLCFVVLMGIAWVAPGSWGTLDIHDPAQGYTVLRCVAEFSLGVLTWRVWRSGRAEGGATRLELPVLGLFAVLWYLRVDLAIVALVPVLVFLCATRRALLARVLGAGVPRFFGDISYALYLVHGWMMGWVPDVADAVRARGIPLADGVTVVLVVGVAIGLATVLFHVIELPARRWLRRLGSKQDRGFAPHTAHLGPHQSQRPWTASLK